MKVTHLVAVLPFASGVFSQAPHDCQQNRYQILEDLEFKTLRAELKNNIPSAKNDNTLNTRELLSAKFYKRRPQNRISDGQLQVVTLSQAQQAQRIKSRLRPGDPHEERSISERVMRGWCVVFTNCPSPPGPGGRGNLYDNVLGGTGLDGSPTPRVKKRHDTILRMLDSVSTAGAITFFTGPDNTKAHPPPPGAPKLQTSDQSNMTINVETKWRGDSLPPGAPRPGNVFATYPYDNSPGAHNKRAQNPPMTFDAKSSRTDESLHWSSKPPSPRNDRIDSGLFIRDDLNDDFCFPKDIKDWHLLSKSLWTNVVHPRFAWGVQSVELDIVHPGIAGKNDIVGGGQVRIRFWISQNPEIDDPKKSALGPAPDRPSEAKTIPYLECYDAYIPKGEDPTRSDIGELWQENFLNACTGPNGFGADATKKTIPKYFAYEGVSHAGQGWKGEFFPDVNCKAQIACQELAGPVSADQFPDIWELSVKCHNLNPEKYEAFHGGIMYHQVPKPGGKPKETVNCGYTRITPVSKPGPIPPPPKKYEIFSSNPRLPPPAPKGKAPRNAKRDAAAASIRGLPDRYSGVADWFDPDWHPPRHAKRDTDTAAASIRGLPDRYSGVADSFDPDWHPPRG